MDLFRTPGASLEGADRKKFDEVKDLVDSATNDFLVRADWNANMACVDAVNTIRNSSVINEVLFLLRKKIASKSAQTVGLTMQLIGSFVNNCGARFHSVLNDEKLTRDITNAVRYFSKRPGVESKDVTDVSLDLIQSWGEAFLPRRRDYYFIVDMYFNLRKEGLPFKPQQFDPNRVPIFVNETGGGSGHTDNTDAILAAALQSSMAMEDQRQAHHHPRGNDRGDHHNHSHPPAHSRQEEFYESRDVGGSGSSTAEVVQSLRSCMLILKELILASTNHMDFRQNDVAQDVLLQLQVYQSKMPALIEQGLMSDPEGVEALFVLNEDSQSLTRLFESIKNGDVGLLDGHRQARAISCGEKNTEAFRSVDQVARSHVRDSPSAFGNAGDLLDMGELDSYPQPQPQAAHHSHHEQQHYQQQERDPHHHIQHQQPHQQYESQGPHRSSPPVQVQQQHHHVPHLPPSQPQSRHSPQVVSNKQGGIRLAPPSGHHAVPAHHVVHGQPSAVPHTHSPHMMHPPSSVARVSPPHAHPATRGEEKIISLPCDDPFTTDSLDALFTGVPAAPPHARHDDGSTLTAPKDPFSPDALDALFETKPPAPTKPDPFSEQALDALFAAPAPHHAHHQGGPSSHPGFAAQQIYQPQQQHHGSQQVHYQQHQQQQQQQQQQQAYPPAAYPAAAHYPSVAAPYPPQHSQQAQPQYAQPQYAQAQPQYAQPQYAQAQYAQAQPQYAQPQYAQHQQQGPQSHAPQQHHQHQQHAHQHESSSANPFDL